MREPTTLLSLPTLLGFMMVGSTVAWPMAWGG
jgi:hypothetical protein